MIPVNPDLMAAKNVANWNTPGSIQLLKSMLRTLASFLFFLSIYPSPAAADSDSDSSASTDSARVFLFSDVDWQALNPARGDMSPRAGTLWGNRNAEVSTGFLAEFKDGFSSPPHIHNVTYRAVVIAGNIHNDDPEAEDLWMGPGSFWTQPSGESHITSAQGEYNLALVEIDHGPYLVKSPSESFDNGERPINIHASNLVWLPYVSTQGQVPEIQVAYLWGKHKEGASRGIFLKFAPDFATQLKVAGNEFHGVVIQGVLNHAASKRPLTPGSYFGSKQNTMHKVVSGSESETIIYIRTNNQLDMEIRN